ncbi:MAG: ATP-dependent helicase [Hyphomicrobiaceae bacterium]|nr:MAG: ATP-dependent helicase [Hyphomicrobiaceae bacterium]
MRIVAQCALRHERESPLVKHLKTLNADQRRAVEFGVAAGETSACGPLLIIAGAGSGKTTTLASRVAHLIVNGADPARILLLTFSRRAAGEMTKRVERIVADAFGDFGPRAAIAVPWSGTFHSVGARLLRMFANRIGLAPTFSIHDREDSADLLNLVRHDLGLADKATRFPLKSTCLGIYSHVVNSGESIEGVLARHFPWCAQHEQDLRGLFAGYVTAKQAQGVLDYDDLLLYWAEMMQVEEVAGDVRALFDHVLVDEYQDTNPLQARALLGVKPDGKGLTAVGDDAQSIYGFRAASVRNILDFPGKFTPSAAVVTLERNYRSTAPILEASNAVIALARERFSKDLWTDRRSADRPQLVTVSDDLSQVGYVTERILANREAGIALKSQAVLFRTAHHSGMLEIELARRNIPFVKFGGLKFLESAHVKDVIAVLRWAENPSDKVVGFRVLQLLPGVGPQTAAKVLDRLATSGPPFAPLTIYRPPTAAQEHWQAFAALLSRLNGQEIAWPAEFEAVCAWFEPHLERRYPDATVRRGDLEQLMRIANIYATRQRFLTEITLDPPEATSDEAGPPLLDEDYLILSTIHSAKGQEWQAVFVLNVVDGCIPSDMATGSGEEIEEERRLLYVAMTRAKEQLHLIVPQRFYVHQQPRGGDRHLFASRTRFIPSNMVGKFEATAWPARRMSPAAASSGKGSVDLKERLGGMWKARA